LKSDLFPLEYFVPIPPSCNDPHHQNHVEILLRSFQHWTGRELITPSASLAEAAQALYLAPFAVVSHDTQQDPVFNYGNAAALKLFELPWEDFTRLPSKQSAEPEDREQRKKILEGVARDGYMGNYRGVRVSASGKRFVIEDAIIWNLLDANGNHYGQAARIGKWRYL
jgi:hypothetical protein